MPIKRSRVALDDADAASRFVTACEAVTDFLSSGDDTPAEEQRGAVTAWVELRASAPGVDELEWTEVVRWTVSTVFSRASRLRSGERAAIESLLREAHAMVVAFHAETAARREPILMVDDRSFAGTPGALTALLDDLRSIQECIDEIPEPRSTLLRLLYLKGIPRDLAYEMIAGRHGCDRARVASWHQRALQELRRRLLARSRARAGSGE